MGPKRTELQDIIVYLAHKTCHLTEERLNKLIYIGEMYSAEILGKRLTDVPFKNYFYGPWSARICDEGEEIAGVDIDVKREKTLDGHEATFFVKIEGRKMEIDLSEEKTAVLDKVLEDWGFKPTDNLVKFAKSTRPFRRSEPGEVLDLERYVGLVKIVYSKEAIEAVKRSHIERKEGKGRIFINKTELQKYYDEL